VVGSEYNIGTLIILALDTTNRTGSVAVVRGDDVLAELVGDPSVTHAQRLPTDLGRVLAMGGLALADVGLLAVTAGPGSFTGLRVGIATVQGLATGRGLRVVAVSTLDALARAGRNQARPIGAWMDAQRGEVFATLYEAGGMAVIVPAMSATPGRVLECWRPALQDREAVFIGDGAVRYAGAIEEALGARATVVPPPPLAAVAARMAAEHPARAVLPHAIVPIYVRRPDVELTRDRRGGAG
jgi:tRNA threonylcarbamoyladenosine biosynthesis protein TsaB